MYCSNCGNKLAQNSVYCSKCGTEIVRKAEESINSKVESSHPFVQLKESDSSKGKYSLIFLIIGIVLLFIGIYGSMSPATHGLSISFILSHVGSFFITISYISFLVNSQEKKKDSIINIFELAKKNIAPSIFIIILVFVSIIPILSWLITFPIFYFLIKKTVQKTPIDEISSPSFSKKDNSVVLIISGIIIFVIGLIGILMRGEIAVKILGKGHIAKDLLLGGGSTGDALTVVAVVGAISMILGLVLFVKGIIKAFHANQEMK